MTDHGRVLRRARLPWHRATTASLQGAYPFLTAPGLAARLGGSGLVIGRDWHGAAFSFDPFTLYAAGLLTNPNMLVVGQVGSGKSALVKTLLWRAVAFGYAAWVADPKGEYGDLAAAAGAPVIRLGPGEPARLNPLDAGQDAGTGPSVGVESDVARREQELVLGHGDYRFLGLLTVTAATDRLLDQACRQAEHDARAAGLEIRRLYGEQDQAFAASLPLARGLR